MRPLTLHASALSDDEYALYTSGISDLALCDNDTLHEDRFYEEITISVRETRAWLRGRYPDIPIATIDSILKFFSPILGQGDTLSGGQFFAALRLVVHAQNGKEVDRSLAFIQARPTAPPPQPRRSADSSNNPFAYELGYHPPLHPSQRSESSANNPFVPRSKSLSSSKLPPLPPPKPSTSTSSGATPSLPPPRHTTSIVPTPPIPPHVVSPLMQQSLMASKTAKTMKKAEEQLEKERVLQVLRSSAVSNGRTPSREASPSKRVLGVKSDADKPPALPRRRPGHSPAMSTSSLEQVALAIAPPRGTVHSPTRSSIDLPPPTHPDRKPPLLSTHVDNHGTSPISSPEPSPSSLSPAYLFSVDSASPTTPTQQQQSRMFRSKSLHYHPTTTSTTAAAAVGKGPPPLPPPKPPIYSKRKRPESMQVVSPSSCLGADGGGPGAVTASPFIEAKNSIFAPTPPGQRRSSYSSSPGGDATTAGTIQRKLQELQLNAMPVLEKARYKAEAGLSPRRGFIPSSGAINGVEGRKSIGISRSRREEREGLLGQDSGDDDDDDGDDYPGRTLRVERDEMKWPVGEGWNRL